MLSHTKSLNYTTSNFHLEDQQASQESDVSR